MNTKANYTERKTFVLYDNDRYLLYLNEEAAKVETGEGDDTTIVDGYAYTGDQPDGSTMIQVDARTVCDENRRAKFVAGLIGKRYSLDDQIALLANGSDTEEHRQELHAFEAYRAECKAKVDELLSR